MDGEVVGLVMKLYRSSLGDFITDLVKWPVLPIVEISCQISAGLAEMHRYGIVHCDLKKNNVLCDIDELGILRAYITDFGVSQIMLGNEKVQSRVNIKMKALSIAYASNEVLI